MKKALLNSKGFIMFEAVIATAFFAIFATVFVRAYGLGLETIFTASQRQQAYFLAKEGLEATRAIRDENFDDLLDGAHGLTAGSTWSFSGVSETIDNFSRQVEITTIDDDRKEISSTVSWEHDFVTQSISLATLLTHWTAAISSGSWALPKYLGTIDMSGAQDGLKVQVAGDYAYVIRNNSSPDFLVVDISTPTAPVIVGSTTIASTPRNLYLTSNYAVVTSNDNSAEVTIVNVSNPLLPTISGTYNALGNTDANGIFAISNTVYFSRIGNGSTNEFNILNITNPAAPTLSGSLNLGSSGTYSEIFVSGSYAYVVSSVNSPEFNVINVSNPAVPTLVTTRDLPGNDDALTISGSGNTLAVGRANGLISVIDVTNPLAPSIVAPITVSYNVNDLAFSSADNYLFVANDNNASELQIWDLTVPASPTLVGSFNTTDDLNGLAYDSVNDQIVAVSDVNTEEFLIIAPGP